MYEYKFIEVPLKRGFRVKKGDSFKECKNIIDEEARNGWRLKQIVMPIDENNGVYTPYCYQIIFERKID